MKNITFSRPVAYALIVALLDIAGILCAFLLIAWVGKHPLRC